MVVQEKLVLTEDAIEHLLFVAENQFGLYRQDQAQLAHILCTQPLEQVSQEHIQQLFADLSALSLLQYTCKQCATTVLDMPSILDTRNRTLCESCWVIELDRSNT